MNPIITSEVYQIGEGHLVSGNATTPFSSLYRVSRHAFLYAWEEFESFFGTEESKTIFAISFEIESFSPQVLQNFCCKMGQGLMDEYPDEEAQFNSNLTKVFCRPIQISSTGWKRIDFDNTYVMHRNTHLEIELSFENNTFSENTQVYCHEVVEDRNRTICAYGDRLSVEEMAALGSVSTRPNLLIHFR